MLFSCFDKKRFKKRKNHQQTGFMLRVFVTMFVCSILILLSRECNSGAIFGILSRLGVAHLQVFWLLL